MVVESQHSSEQSLDPEDWGTVQQLGHQMIDDMLAYLKTVRERPVWQPIPPSVKQHFRQPAPFKPQNSREVYQEFVDSILPYPEINMHPRGWGWVIGAGTPIGMLADMLASGFNPNLGGGEHVANYVEAQVVDWCKEMMGFSTEASGLLVTGCSMANLTGLAVARNTKAEGNLRRDGLQSLSRRMTLYASQDVHSSIQKAVEMLGLGSDSLRLIRVEADFRIDLSALQQAIQQDRASGYQPFCVVGCAGTTATGAIDNLNELAEICQREGLWFHIDGAFGALAALSPQLRPLVRGMERCDSLAFDFHKWMYVPHDVGCVLVRWKKHHYETFTLTPDYLEHGDDNPVSGEYWFSDYGVELSRGFRALKVWFSIKTYGLETIGRSIQQNVNQAHYLAERIQASPHLELTAPVSLNIVCFRFHAEDLDETNLNELNKRLLNQLQGGGLVMLSNAMIHGKYSLRASITNYRSRREDFDILVDEVVSLGNQLVPR